VNIKPIPNRFSLFDFSRFQKGEGLEQEIGQRNDSQYDNGEVWYDSHHAEESDAPPQPMIIIFNYCIYGIYEGLSFFSPRYAENKMALNS